MVTKTVPVLTILLAGCAAGGDRPITAAEREQAMRAAETAPLARQVGPARCGAASQMAQLQARQNGFTGADGFDARNCPRGEAQNPTITPRR